MSGNNYTIFTDIVDWSTVTWLGESLFPFQALCGILGNMINLAVLLSRPMRNRTNLRLAMVAFCDIMFLLSLSFNYVVRYRAFSQTWLMHLYRAIKIYVTTTVNFFSLASTWFIVVVCFDRLFAIRSPLHTHGSPVRSLIVTATAVFTLSACVAVDEHFIFQLAATRRASGRPHADRVVFKTLTIPAVAFQVVIPMILLVVTNGMLLRHVKSRNQRFHIPQWNASNNSYESGKNGRKASERKISEVQPLNAHRESKMFCRRHSTTERKVTRTIVLIVTLFVVTNLPSSVLFIVMYAVYDGDWYRTKQELAFVIVSSSFVITGKLCNFFLLCNSSAHFRLQIKKYFKKQFRCLRTRKESESGPTFRVRYQTTKFAFCTTSRKRTEANGSDNGNCVVSGPGVVDSTP